MRFGVKTPDEVDSPSTGGNFIRYFNKDGSYTLRFLEPWTEWIAYHEHFSEEFRCSYPCTATTPAEMKDCPGCQLKDKTEDPRAVKEARRSKKYLVNAIRTDDPDAEGYVHLWKLPGGLKEQLVLNWTKDGSMSKREYNVIRYEKAGRTNYTLDKEDPTPFNAELYEGKLQDKEEALLESWKYRWDEAHRTAAQESQKAKTEEVRVNNFNSKPQEAEPPFDPTPVTEEEVLGESDIRAMDADQLKVWFKRAGVPIPDTDDPAELADTLISALESP